MRARSCLELGEEVEEEDADGDCDDVHIGARKLGTGGVVPVVGGMEKTSSVRAGARTIGGMVQGAKRTS